MMNFWQEGGQPFNWAEKNQTSKWLANDTEVKYNAKPHSVYDANSIVYQMNSLGFREKELDTFLETKVNVTLGCSFTSGIGLPNSEIWPSLIKQRTTTPLVNLGIGGASGDTVARVLMNVVGLLAIQSVYILWPSPIRFETYDHNNINPIMPINSQIEHMWFQTESESNQRRNKNKAIVRMLATIHKFNVVALDIDPYIEKQSNGIFKGTARDHLHAGPEFHVAIAADMLKLNEL